MYYAVKYVNIKQPGEGNLVYWNLIALLSNVGEMCAPTECETEYSGRDIC
jgi:hypothetical protein